MKRIAQQMLGTTGVKLLQAFLSLINLVLLARHFGDEALGVISIIVLTISIIQILIEFVTASLVYYASRFQLFSLLKMSYAWIFGLITLVIVLMEFLQVFPKLYQTLFVPGFNSWVLLTSLASGIYFSHLAALLGREKIAAYNQILSVQLIMITVLLLGGIYVFSGTTFIWFIKALFLSYLVGIIYSSIIIFRLKPIHDLPPVTLKVMLSYGSQTQLSTLMHIFNKRFHYYIIKGLMGNGPLGVYNAAVQLMEGLRLLSQSIALVQMSKVANMDDPQKAAYLSLKLMKFSLVLSLLGVMVLLVLPADFYVALLGSDFESVHPVLYSLAIGVLALSINASMSHHFSGTGQPRYNVYASATGLLVVIPTALFLIPRFGLTGAGISASLAYLAASFYQLVTFLKKYNFSLKDCFPGKEELEDIKSFIRRR